MPSAHTVKQCLYDLHACLRLHTIRSATYLTRNLLSNRGSPIITVSSGKTPERELLQPVWRHAYTPNFKRPARTFCPNNAYDVMLAHSPWRAWLQIYFLDIVIIHLQSVTKGVPILVCCQVCFSRYISTAFCCLLSFGTYLRHNRDVNLTWPWPSSTYRMTPTPMTLINVESQIIRPICCLKPFNATENIAHCAY